MATSSSCVRKTDVVTLQGNQADQGCSRQIQFILASAAAAAADMLKISDLPTDVCNRILAKVDANQLMHMSRVNRFFRDLLRDPQVYSCV